jgi:phosphatidylinositol-3-phosphatase
VTTIAIVWVVAPVAGFDQSVAMIRWGRSSGRGSILTDGYQSGAQYRGRAVVGRLGRKAMKRPLFALTSSLLLLAVAVFAAPLVGAASSLSASADSYVSSSAPTANYGKATQIRFDRSPAVLSYLRFDLGSMSGVVTSATLQVYANSSSSTGYEVHRTSSVWSETGITWANAPAVGTLVSTMGAFGANTTTSVDVTPAITPGAVVAFVLVGRGPTAVSLGSRESSRPPLLVLTLAPATTAPPATATPTDTPLAGATPLATAAPSDTPLAGATPLGTAAPSDTPPADPTPPATAAPTDTLLADATPPATAVPTDLPVADATPPATATLADSPSPSATAANGHPHVMVVFYEGQSGDPVGNTSAPYITSLANAYSYDSNWWAVAHPSLPNYLAVVSGGTQGCTSDSCGQYPADNLGNQLSNAGIPWTAYMEAMPSACFTGSGSGAYAGKHNPFIHFSDVVTGGSCATHDVPYPGPAAMVSQLDGPNPPDFVWITPNLQNDMHDGTIAQGDAWLKANLPSVLGSAWFAQTDSTIIFTMDENNLQGSPAGGQIPMIVISNRSVGGVRLTTYGNLYGTLRAIEEAYGLPLLGGAGDTANGDPSVLFGR